MTPSIVFCVSADNELFESLQTVFERNKNAVLHVYSDIVSALNALRNSNPQIVVVNADDFPRHWKIFSQVLSPEHSRLFIFSSKGLPDAELKKASAIGVSVVSEVSREITELVPNGPAIEPPDDGPSIAQNQPISVAGLPAALVVAARGKMSIHEIRSIDRFGIRCEPDLPPFGHSLDAELVLSDAGSPPLRIAIFRDNEDPSYFRFFSIPPELRKLLATGDSPN